MSPGPGGVSTDQGTVVAVGALAEYPAAESGSGGVHRVRGGPGGVGRSSRAGARVGTDLRGCVSCGLGGVFTERVSFLGC
jgi:hypothetical protein